MLMKTNTSITSRTNGSNIKILSEIFIYNLIQFIKAEFKEKDRLFVLLLEAEIGLTNRRDFRDYKKWLQRLFRL